MSGIHNKYLDQPFKNLNTVTTNVGCPFTELTDFDDPLNVPEVAC